MIRFFTFIFVAMSFFSLASFADHPDNGAQEYVKMSPIADDYVGKNAVTTADDYMGKNAVTNITLKVNEKRAQRNYTSEEKRCLSEAIYYEARGESRKGRVAVAEVVLNRAKSKKFPKDVCGVVYQQYKNICQFSFACNGSMKNKKNAKHWELSKALASEIIEGKNKDVSGGALFFHANYVNPRWASKMVKTINIGAHSFYRP